MRMSRAAVDREVFGTDAIVLLHEATAGAMRDLDRLATAALRETARKKRTLVERDVVVRIIGRYARSLTITWTARRAAAR